MPDEFRCSACGGKVDEKGLCPRCDMPCNRCNHTRRLHVTLEGGHELCPTAVFKPYPKKA